MAFKPFDAEVQNLQMSSLVISFSIKVNILNDFSSIQQNIDKKMFFNSICKKISIFIDLSYIIGKFMVKLHKMQIFIFNSKVTS